MSDPRTLSSGLLLATGAAHVVHFLVQGMAGAAAPLGVFGIAYLAIGLWLRRPGRGALVAGIVVPALGGAGGLASLARGGDPVMLAYVLVDAAVIVLLIVALRSPAASQAGGAQ